MHPDTTTPDRRPFWKTTRLEDMTPEQWEALCDGCARCCLHKLQDQETGRIFVTMIACRLLDRQTCRCRDYPQRQAKVTGCLVLSAACIDQVEWLPATCAYRKLAVGQSLDWWHPLISGDRTSVHRAGISVRGLSLSEGDVHPDEWGRFILGEANRHKPAALHEWAVLDNFKPI